MKQFLRSLWTLLLLMMWCSVGFAQTTIWSEDWTGQEGKEPNKVSPMYSVKNSSIRSSDDYAEGTAPELMIKTNGTWTVTISDLKGCNNSFTLSFKTNRHDTKKYISVTANGKTISCPKEEGNTSTHSGTFELNVATGKNLVLIFKANGDNCRIDDIKLTGTPVESKPTLTFSETEKTVYKGAESEFTMPTLVLKDKDGKEVTSGVGYLYEVTDANPEGCLDVDMTTGKITFNKLGTANIKVTTSTTDSGSEFNNLTASYILNYKKRETTLTLSKTSVSVNLGETPELPTCTLKAGDEIITNKTLAYTITPEGIANINATTGELTLISAGKATVNVSFIGDETYEASNIASYDLTVVDPNATETSTTFDFTKPEKYNYGVTKTNDNGGTPAFGDGEGDVTLNKTIVSDDVTITNTKVDGYGTRFWNNSDLRVYSNNEHVVSVPNGYYITSIVIKATNQSKYAKYEIGDNKVGTDWTGNAQSVTITYTGNSRLTSMKVTYTKPSYKTFPLDETTTAEDAKTLLKANQNKTVNVTINRTLVANKWNTLCLPFDVTAEQIKNILKAEGMVREYKDQTADCINFQAAETMTAGVPYLIKPTEEVKGLTFEGVKITAIEGVAKGAEAGSTDENLSICGVLGAKALSTDGSELFLNAAGKFVAPAAATNTMKGFRAYFMSMLGAGAKINIDGETTGINNIETNAAVNGKVYNLNGQYVGNSLNGLKKGIYVVNGKKVIK